MTENTPGHETPRSQTSEEKADNSPSPRNNKAEVPNINKNERDVLTRDLHLSTPPNERSRRIILEAWKRSNRPNKRAGDVLELHWRTPHAKPFIGWWDSTDPENPTMKAWMGAHDLANNPRAEPHRHWSIEVSDSSGQMQTRLAIKYDRDHTNIYTSSSDFSVTYGALRVTRGRLEFAASRNDEGGDERWSIHHTGGSRMYDLLLNRHSDDGSPRPIGRLNRETGNFAIGGDFIAERSLHVRHSSKALLVEGMHTSTNAGLVTFRHSGPERRVLHTEVKGEVGSRFSLETSGRMEWGSDTSERKLSVAPEFEASGSPRLRIHGGDLDISSQGKGLILRDSVTGKPHRVRIAKGEIELQEL